MIFGNSHGFVIKRMNIQKYLLFQTEDGQTKIVCRLEDESFAFAGPMGELFS
jgi:hypothetical protein